MDYNNPKTEVCFVGGPFDGCRAELSYTPRRLEVNGSIYTSITDPDTGDFLGGYAYSSVESPA